MNKDLYDLNPTLIKNLSYTDFVKLCQGNQEYAKYCNDNTIWHHFMLRDFPLYVSKDKNYKRQYQLLKK